MAINRNVIVPVPENASISWTERRVYITIKKVYDPEKKYNTNVRVTIGKINDQSGKTMNPNANYARLYPDAYADASSGKLPPSYKKIGMYTATLACAVKLGLYPALVQSCGPVVANAVMDYASYSIRCKSNVASAFEQLMAEQLLYSDQLYSDSWFGELFNHKITETSIEDFKRKWIEQCKLNGLQDVFLCIDGSNNDCSSENVEMAEPGHAKSGTSGGIYAYMYAVSAEDGTPVTYKVFRGGQVDSKSFVQMNDHLVQNGFKVKGVIIDRGFCDQDVYGILISDGYKYLMMMKENVYGFTSQLQKYGSEIKDKIPNLVKKGTFACTNKGRVFKNNEHESWITLVYETKNAGEIIDHFTGKVLDELESYQEKYIKYEAKMADWIIKNQQEEALGIPESQRQKAPSVPEISIDMKKYLKVAADGQAAFTREMQKAVDKKGFYALACSDPWPARQVLDTYDLRDCSEKQFSIAKTQLGYYTGRSHCDKGIHSRQFVAFVAGILRNQMRLQCRAVRLSFNTMLRELDFMKIECLNGCDYHAVRSLNDKQIRLLKSLDLTEKDLEYFAEQETIRINSDIFNQVARLPEKQPEPKVKQKQKPVKEKNAKRKSVKSKESTDQDKTEIIKRGRGRPAGAKNKRTDLDDVVDAILAKEEKAKKSGRSAGRPKGALNKPKNPEGMVKEKGKPGRHKGSKNKRTILREQLQAWIEAGNHIEDFKLA